MVTYRIAEKSEYGKAAAVWKECFGDSDEYIENYIRFCADEVKLLVCSEGEEILSMLFLMPLGLKTERGVSRVSYIYAGGTPVKYRGRGYYSSLCRFAEKTAAEAGSEYICLMPGEESLYAYYAGMGYEKCLERRILRFSREELEKSACTENRRIPYLFWNDRIMEYAVSENRIAGGKYLTFRGGYAFGYEDDGVFIVYDSLFEDYGCFRNSLLENTDAASFEISVPVGTRISGGVEMTVPGGVIKRTDGGPCGITGICPAITFE